jgi:hypothetical protein
MDYMIMHYTVKKLTYALLAVSFLFGLTACGNLPSAKGAPSMADYAYVPQSGNATVYTPYTLESY